MLQTTQGPAAEIGISLKDLLQILGGILAFIGVILTIVYTGRRQQESFDKMAKLQLDADERKHRTELELCEQRRKEEVRVARGVLFAQLSRVYRTTQGEYGYLAHSKLPFVWIAFYHTLLPSSDNLNRAEMLTVEEVVDVTAFYYSYQENMGYIATASGGEGRTTLKFDFHLVGVDYRVADLQLKWLMDALGVIERKAAAAMATIEASTKADDQEAAAAQKFGEEIRRNEELAKKADPNRLIITERIASASAERRAIAEREKAADA